MEYTINNAVLVPGTIKSIADGGIVAHSNDIYDTWFKGSQSEVNKQLAERHLTTTDKYGWCVLNRTDYDNMIEHLDNVLYFIVGDDEPIESASRLENNILFINSMLKDTTLEIPGTLNNNTLTL